MALDDYLETLDDLRRRGIATDVAYTTLADLVKRGQEIGTALTDLARGETTRATVSFAEITALARDLETFAATYYTDLDYPADLFQAVRAAQRSLFDLTTFRRHFAAQSTTAASQAEGAPSRRGLVPYQLRRGDSLEHLASAFLGAVARWSQIALLNDLVFPFLETDRDFAPAEFDPSEFEEDDFLTKPQPDRTGVADGVKVTGEVIWLPPDAHVPGRDSPFLAEDVELFGRDIAVLNGVLQITTDGDVITVAGKPNIVQALGQRIRTVRGELLLHRDYGIERRLAIGVEGTWGNVVLSGLELARTVAQDPRVTGVTNPEILFEQTVNRLAMTVGLIGPQERVAGGV
jgi:hypothetical protein